MKFKLAIVSVYPERSGIITGGVEGVSHCLVSGLQQIAELEIHVLAPAIHRPSGLEKRDGITIHWLKVGWLPFFLANFSTFRWRIQGCLAKINPDLTHFQGTASWLLNYNRPHLFTIHGIYERDLLYRKGPFLALRRAVIGFSEAMGRRRSPHTILISPYVLEEIGYQIAGQHWHIENPVTDDFFQLKRVAVESRVLFVGRVCARKNVDGLLRAFALARQQLPGMTLHIAGTAESREYEQSCRRLVAEHGLEEAVTFLGNIDRANLLHELKEASCLALISFQETAPMIVEEAMAAGLPVVVSRVCGLPYMVEEGITGFLLEPEAEEAIAARFVQLLQDKTLNETMGMRCRMVARERFHANRVAERTIAVYQHILGLTGPTIKNIERK